MVTAVSVICVVFLSLIVIVVMLIRTAERIKREGGGDWRILFGISQVTASIMTIVFLWAALRGLSLYLKGLVANPTLSLVSAIGLLVWIVMMIAVNYRYMITEGRV